MKRILTILILLTTFTLVGCRNSENESIENYIEANEMNISAAMESIAGIWYWPPDNGGNPIYVGADGTWYHTLGDAEVRGKVELTQDSENFMVEFVAIEGSGPGFVREGSFNPQLDAYVWVPVPYPIGVWFSGIYYVDYDRLFILDFVNDWAFEMQRDRPEAPEIDIASLFISSLAGVWNWPDYAENPIFVNPDGTWSQMQGNVLISGEIELTQDGGNFAFQFIATKGRGPGIEGSFNPRTNAYYSVPIPIPNELGFFGTYLVEYDRLLVLSHPDHPEMELGRV